MSSLDKRRVVSYSLLQLPPRDELRRLGLSDDPRTRGMTRDHLLAKWEVHPFPKDAPADANDAIDMAKAAAGPRTVKVRVTFVDGSVVILSRASPADLSSPFKSTTNYDPQEVFVSTTGSKATEERNKKHKELQFLVGANGRPLKERPPTSLSHFHPSKLFADCPRPHTSQTGFSFTPISSNSFMVRPNYRIPGCRPGIGEFSEQAANFRPRGFNTETFANEEEIDGRNSVSRQRISRAGGHVHNSVFMRSLSAKHGGPLSPPNAHGAMDFKNSSAGSVGRGTLRARPASSTGGSPYTQRSAAAASLPPLSADAISQH